MKIKISAFDSGKIEPWCCFECNINELPYGFRMEDGKGISIEEIKEEKHLSDETIIIDLQNLINKYKKDRFFKAFYRGTEILNQIQRMIS